MNVTAASSNFKVFLNIYMSVMTYFQFAAILDAILCNTSEIICKRQFTAWDISQSKKMKTYRLFWDNCQVLQNLCV
jgi:hypothetical protein